MTNAQFSHDEGYTKEAEEEYQTELVPCEQCGGLRHPEFGCPECDDEDLPDDVKYCR